MCECVTARSGDPRRWDDRWQSGEREEARNSKATKEGTWEDGAPVGRGHGSPYLLEVWARKIRNGKKRNEGRPFDGVRAVNFCLRVFSYRLDLDTHAIAASLAAKRTRRDDLSNYCNSAQTAAQTAAQTGSDRLSLTLPLSYRTSQFLYRHANSLVRLASAFKVPGASYEGTHAIAGVSCALLA